VSKQAKRMARLASLPKDYEWSELESLLRGLGFEVDEGSGSRVAFFLPSRPDVVIHLHEPHNRNPRTIFPWVLKDVLQSLRELGFYEGQDS
jgi:hypothetical protein